MVGIDEVDARIAQGSPAFGLIRVSPEPDGAALFVGTADQFAEFHVFGLGERAFAAPLEVGAPVITDERHEAGRGIRVEVGEASVIGGVAGWLLSKVVARAVAGEGDRDGIGDGAIALESSEHPRIILEHPIEHLIGGESIGLDIDEQVESRGG